MASTIETQEMGEMFETFIRAGQDSKGRVVGYIVGLREVIETGEFYAWVQKAIELKDGFKDFGVSQRSRKFENLNYAKAWAYAEAKKRISKLTH